MSIDRFKTSNPTIFVNGVVQMAFNYSKKNQHLSFHKGDDISDKYYMNNVFVGTWQSDELETSKEKCIWSNWSLPWQFTGEFKFYDHGCGSAGVYPEMYLTNGWEDYGKCDSLWNSVKKKWWK